MRDVKRYTTITGLGTPMCTGLNIELIEQDQAFYRAADYGALAQQVAQMHEFLVAQQQETYQAVSREHAVKKELIAWKHTAKSQDALDEEMDGLEQQLAYAKALLVLDFFTDVDSKLECQILQLLDRTTITDADLDDARALIEKGAP